MSKRTGTASIVCGVLLVGCSSDLVTFPSGSTTASQGGSGDGAAGGAGGSGASASGGAAGAAGSAGAGGGCSTAGDCDDLIACTTDSCDNSTCFNVPDAGLCTDDGASCTVEACEPGSPNADTQGCTHAPDQAACEDGISCSLDACDPLSPGADPTTGCLQTLDSLACADGASCTNDSCDPTNPAADPGSGCVVAPDDVACADLVDCTLDACNPADPSSNPGTGCVNQPDALACDDASVCTTDACDPTMGCTHSAISCDDTVVATFDFCDPSLGCQNIAGSCFADNFESLVSTWTFSLPDDGAGWSLLPNPQTIANAAACVGSPLAHLPAFNGNTVLWYGSQPVSGTSGNYGDVSSCVAGTGRTLGTATSPVFVIPASKTPEIHFWTWWEIECTTPAAFDLMRVQLSVDGGFNYTTLRTLNSMLQPCGATNNDGLSNAGASFATMVPSTPNVEGVWQEIVVTAPTVNVATSARLRFNFDTNDGWFNYFRGWHIDTAYVLCP